MIARVFGGVEIDRMGALPPGAYSRMTLPAEESARAPQSPGTVGTHKRSVYALQRLDTNAAASLL